MCQHEHPTTQTSVSILVAVPPNSKNMSGPHCRWYGPKQEHWLVYPTLLDMNHHGCYRVPAFIGMSDILEL